MTLALAVVCSCNSGIARLDHSESDRFDTENLLVKSGEDSLLNSRRHECVSSITAKPDGSVIFLAWYTGGEGEGPGNYVTLAVSTDKGQSWKLDELLVVPRNRDSVRFFDPVLWTDPAGDVWLYYALSTRGRHWDMRGGVTAVKIDWDGEKIVCGKPRLRSYGVMMNKPLALEGKDLVLYPVSVWLRPETDRNAPEYIRDGTYILKSRKCEDGELKNYSHIPLLPDPARTFDEHMIVQVDGAHLMCLHRGRMIYYSESFDWGRTWSGLKPYTAPGPTTSSRFNITRLSSGNLLLVYNNSYRREKMTAAISEDGGMSWFFKNVIDARDMVSYPDTYQTADGTIHMTYDRDRSGSKEIWYCRFTEDDLRSKNAKDCFRINLNAIKYGGR